MSSNRLIYDTCAYKHILVDIATTMLLEAFKVNSNKPKPNSSLKQLSMLPKNRF